VRLAASLCRRYLGREQKAVNGTLRDLESLNVPFTDLPNPRSQPNIPGWYSPAGVRAITFSRFHALIVATSAIKAPICSSS